MADGPQRSVVREGLYRSRQCHDVRRATRQIDGKTTTDVRIFALSRKLSPQALLETARAHWQIENALHWQLDVSFGDSPARQPWATRGAELASVI